MVLWEKEVRLPKVLFLILAAKYKKGPIVTLTWAFLQHIWSPWNLHPPPCLALLWRVPQALDSEFKAFQSQALMWQSQRHKVQRLSEMLSKLHRAVMRRGRRHKGTGLFWASRWWYFKLKRRGNNLYYRWQMIGGADLWVLICYD